MNGSDHDDEGRTVCDRCSCECETDDTVTGTDANGEWSGCVLCSQCDEESQETK